MVLLFHLLLGQLQLTLSLFVQHLHLLLDRQLVSPAAVPVHSLDPSTQGLAGFAHLEHRLWHELGAVNYLAELLQLFICQTVAVKKFQLLEEIKYISRKLQTIINSFIYNTTVLIYY